MSEFVRDLVSGNIVEAITQSYGTAMPPLLFAGVLASAVLASLYINSRSVVLVGLVSMLSGGVIVQSLPPQLRTLGYALVLVAVAAVGSSIYLGRSSEVRP
jgi:hypothetical protein